MTNTVQMDEALAQRTIWPIWAVEIVLPFATVRLLAAPLKSLTFDSRTFYSKSDDWGVWTPPDALQDGSMDSAESLSFTIRPPTVAAGASLIAEEVQNSVVRIWRGLWNASSGKVIADPVRVRTGFIDVPTLTIDKSGALVDYAVASAEERWFDQDDAIGLNDAFHQSLRPGERGFEYAVAASEPVYWGSKTPLSAGAQSLYQRYSFAEAWRR